MMYRKFASWADTGTLRTLYLTCIRPHLEYACQLWVPYTRSGIDELEKVQKYACKVCLKCWNMDYKDMLDTLEIPELSSRRTYLKLCTMYKITHGNLFFPDVVFLQNNQNRLRNHQAP